jgi:tetratricopeptide (TPR) repeat protein
VKTTSWILLALALVVLGALGGLMLSGGQGEPRDLLESALRRFNGPEQDTEATLKELELALRSAESSGDSELAADILIARGRVLSDVGAFGPARADLERALERYRPGSVDIELELVALDEETGELAAGLERAKRITDRDPGQLQAWRYSGQILMKISEQRLDELKAVCDGNLAAPQSKLALEYASKAAGMNSDDPLRVSQLARLRSLFDPPDQSDSLKVLALTDAASSATSLAREALVRSFAGPLDRDAVLSYLELLARSGRSRDAADFGLAVAPHRLINSSPRFMERLARVLIDAGRADSACEVIEKHYNRSAQPDQQFYATWCEALYKAERWKALTFVAGLMRTAGNQEYRSKAVFYIGLGHAGARQAIPTSNALELYLRSEPVEPFPGALAIAWLRLAASWRTQGELNKESAALHYAVRLAPDADGEAWLRLFQIFQETNPNSLEQAERYLTKALCLLPRRTSELMPTWLEVGRRRLRAAGMELELLLADQRKQGHIGPGPQAGPYELFRFAEMHRDAHESVAAAASARRLLLAYPGFLPAMDLLADVERDMGDWRSAARTWLERLHHAGSDPTTLRRLARMPAGTLDSKQRIELMQLDPENTGRLEVARTLQAEGRPLAALLGLDALPIEPLGDEGVQLASELMIEAARYTEALAILAKLSPGRRESARAFELALDAAALLGQEDRLLAIIANPPLAERLKSADLVSRVDLMLARGQIAGAKALLLVLDSRADTRNRDVLLRGAAIALLEHNSTAVQDELDRAEAFNAAGPVAFGRLLAALESRIYNRVPILVRGLFDVQYQPTRLQAAILSILDERLDEARRAIAEARRKDPREPNWALLEAAVAVLEGRTPDLSNLVDESAEPETLFTLRNGELQRDPRPLFARLLALDSPDWRLWAIADMSRIQQPEPGSLWARYEVGRGLELAGYQQEAERAWRVLLRSWPTFAPAWDALERIKLERFKRFDHVEMVRLRGDRRQAVGRRPGEEAEELLTEAWARESAGNLSGALESVRRAVELDPKLAPAWFKLGQLSHRVPNWNEAIVALRTAARTGF